MEDGRSAMPELKRKGITIGSGMPVVCVPVTAKDHDGIIAQIQELCAQGVSMIEWRADRFEQLADEEALKAVLAEIAPLVKDTVLLFTIRSKEQGGESSLAEKKLLYYQELAAKSGCVDLVDIEILALSKPEKAIRRLHAAGAAVIASHHDFSRTPQSGLLKQLLRQMHLLGADIGKIAVMPQDAADTARILALGAGMKKELPDFPLILIGMGKEGVITRIAGETFGSCITFGAGKQASAPGQIEAGRLGEILQTLHEG